MNDWPYDSDACHVHPWNDEPYPCWECEEDWNQEEDEYWEEEWDDGRISY